MSRSRIFAALMLAGLGLTGCTTDARLAYSPSITVSNTGPASVSSVTATDQRREDPNRLATVLGGFGNPLKILNTVRPVKDEVASVFSEGLRARGLQAEGSNAPFRIELLIRKFDAALYMVSTARVDLDMTVVSTATGQVVYKDTVVDERSTFDLLGGGVFADIADLQKLAETVLDAAVDKMLDKPEFRAAVAKLPAS